MDLEDSYRAAPMDLEIDSRSPAESHARWDVYGRRHHGAGHRPGRSARSTPPGAALQGVSFNHIFGMVAHELATPLTTIAIAAGTLRGAVGAGEGLLEVVISQVQRLQSVVADLLDVSRLEHGALVSRPERCQASQVVSQALSALGEEVPADWVSLDSPGPLRQVQVDEIFAQRILVNLIRNAARHGAPPIRISLQPSGSRLDIAVSDAGAGIPSEAVTGLFQPYHSYGATGRLGLGLALSSSLADAMGCRLTLRRASPACFVLTVPFAPREAP